MQVSGPGPMSKRTDRSDLALDLPYGENKELATQQKAAPMAGSGRTSLPPELAMLTGQATPLTAPTQMPEEALTTGMPFGPGAGPEVLASAVTKDGPTRAKLLASIRPMMRLAEQPDASPEFRAAVRYLRSQV